MGSIRLKLKADKTRVTWIVSRQQRDKKVHFSELQLQPAIVQFTDTVSNLGVMVDNQLNMSAHVTAVSMCVSTASTLGCQTFHIYGRDEDWSAHTSAVDL